MVHEKQGPRVEEEAKALGAVGHPGVVELVDLTDGVLRTRRVDGKPLSEMGHVPPEEVAGLAAAVAATLADLHDLGMVHGGVDASHVIVADDGHPVLCSLGRPGQPSDDVAALGRLLLTMTGQAADPLRARLQLRRPRPLLLGRRRLGPMLSPPPVAALTALAAEATAADPDRRPPARALAAALRERVPGARLPRPHDQASEDPPLPAPARPLPLGWAGAGVGLGLLVMALVSWSVMGRGGGGRAGTPEPAADHGTDTSSASTAARVWPPEALQYEQGVLDYRGVRYSVGRPDDAVVAADWACTGEPALVLLRPSSGQVFAFPGWAGDTGEVTSRPIGQVAGGSGLRAVDADGDGCPELEVTRSHGPPTLVEVPR